MRVVGKLIKSSSQVSHDGSILTIDKEKYDNMITFGITKADWKILINADSCSCKTENAELECIHVFSNLVKNDTEAKLIYGELVGR